MRKSLKSLGLAALLGIAGCKGHVEFSNGDATGAALAAGGFGLRSAGIRQGSLPAVQTGNAMVRAGIDYSIMKNGSESPKTTYVVVQAEEPGTLSREAIYSSRFDFFICEDVQLGQRGPIEKASNVGNTFDKDGKIVFVGTLYLPSNCSMRLSVYDSDDRKVIEDVVDVGNLTTYYKERKKDIFMAQNFQPGEYEAVWTLTTPSGTYEKNRTSFKVIP